LLLLLDICHSISIMQPNMTSTLTLTETGRRDLDRIIDAAVQSRTVPAVFVALTDANETIYSRCAGHVDFDDPSRGSVNDDTSELEDVQAVDRNSLDVPIRRVGS
jgi:hypothetical protein